MRRDDFLKSVAALAAMGALPLTARAAANLKVMVPAKPSARERELFEQLAAESTFDPRRSR